MKQADADLFEALNALPDETRADLFAFLGVSDPKSGEAKSVLDSLRASVEMHVGGGGFKPN
jgi:hypothetical protein